MGIQARNLFVTFALFQVSNAAITYQLYTRMNKNMGQPLIYKSAKTVTASNFNAAKKNKMLIHGYGQNGRSDFNRDLKNALLTHDDYNVVVVDWSTAARGSYNAANTNKDAIGQSIAKMIDWMKLDAGYLHLIGFDLGAHIAGVAGKYTTSGRVDKITGLDPTKAGINLNQSANRLSKGDARFVEIYHSNGDNIGIMAHIADSDKYIDNGQTQTGCTSDQCSHEKAWKVYVDQVNGVKYGTYTCESLVELQGRGCGFLASEWYGENTGISQVVTDE